MEFDHISPEDLKADYVYKKWPEDKLTEEARKKGMTSEKIAQALDIYRTHLENQGIPVRKHPGNTDATSSEVLAHCHWMTTEAKVFLAQGRRDKAMRWLCFIQGCLFTLRHFHICDLKNHNCPDAAE